VIAILLVVLGCGSEEEPPPPGRGIVDVQPATMASAPRSFPPRRDRGGPDRRDIRLEPGLMAPAGGEPAIRAEPEAPREQPTMEPPPPDRAAELRALVGDPSSCIGRLEDPPAELSIQVAATVSTSGVVTRYEVSNSRLSDEAIECIGNRLANARFAAPVEDAPRTITATVTVRGQAPETAMTEMTGG
jgi:hypothetical protein